MRLYQHKGHFGAMVAQMPVYVILNARAALLGAASAGLPACEPDLYMGPRSNIFSVSISVTST